MDLTEENDNLELQVSSLQSGDKETSRRREWDRETIGKTVDGIGNTSRQTLMSFGFLGVVD